MQSPAERTDRQTGCALLFYRTKIGLVLVPLLLLRFGRRAKSLHTPHDLLLLFPFSDFYNPSVTSSLGINLRTLEPTSPWKTTTDWLWESIDSPVSFPPSNSRISDWAASNPRDNLRRTPGSSMKSNFLPLNRALGRGEHRY